MKKMKWVWLAAVIICSGCIGFELGLNLLRDEPIWTGLVRDIAFLLASLFMIVKYFRRF